MSLLLDGLPMTREAAIAIGRAWLREYLATGIEWSICVEYSDVDGRVRQIECLGQ